MRTSRSACNALASLRRASSATLLALLAASACPLSGCATMSDVMHAKAAGEGTSRVYPVGKDDAWKAAVAAFRWGGADSIEEHKDEGFMLTSSGESVGTHGTMMGAWVEPAGPQQSRVTVVTKRRLAINAVTTLTETGFHDKFQQAVAILESGRSLPIEAP
jgi:hypothetical protein